MHNSTIADVLARCTGTARQPNAPPPVLVAGSDYYVADRHAVYEGPHQARDVVTVLAASLKGRGMVDRRAEAARMVRDARRVAHTVIELGGVGESCIRLDRDRIVVPSCRRRDLEPREHREIDAWLDVLADDPWRVRYWLIAAVAQEPDEALAIMPALLLWGPGGVGKTVFAQALARLWGDGTCVVAQRAHQFGPREFAANPIMLADERVPHDRTRKADTIWLRDMLAKSTHVIDRTHTLVGQPRLIITSNVCPAQTILCRDEAECHAIGRRVVGVRCRADAVGHIREHASDLDGLIHGDALAEHALWLVGEHEDGRIVLPPARDLPLVDGSGAYDLGLVPDRGLDRIAAALAAGSDDVCVRGDRVGYRPAWAGEDAAALALVAGGTRADKSDRLHYRHEKIPWVPLDLVEARPGHTHGADQDSLTQWVGVR